MNGLAHHGKEATVRLVKFIAFGISLWAHFLFAAESQLHVDIGVKVPESIHSDIGKIIFSAEFKDKRGLNIVYASQYTPFNYGNKSYIDKIWIKQ